MIFFPNCKINLGLNIVSKRDDGYHNLETVFYPLSITDAIEIVQDNNPEDADTDIVYSYSGIDINAPIEKNLCVKAYRLLKKDFPDLPKIKLHLHKSIPIGAGLGGGSADGAFTLQLLNKKFELGLSPDYLADYALSLGSDCPFFIYNKPIFATGRGEIFHPIELNLHQYKIVLVYTGFYINTAEAFSGITPAIPELSIKEIIQLSPENWKEKLVNNFETTVFKKYPELEKIKEQLYKAGAIYASMSGSGSVIYGLFEKGKTIDLNFAGNYYLRESICEF